MPIFSEAQYIRSWVGLPLVYEEKVVALITMDHDLPGLYQPSSEFIRHLQAFAQEATQELVDARLYLQPERRLKDLEIINEVTELMGSKLETDQLLRMIVTEVARQLQCGHCAFFVAEEGDLSSEIVLRPRVYQDLVPVTSGSSRQARAWSVGSMNMVRQFSSRMRLKTFVLPRDVCRLRDHCPCCWFPLRLEGRQLE